MYVKIKSLSKIWYECVFVLSTQLMHWQRIVLNLNSDRRFLSFSCKSSVKSRYAIRQLRVWHVAGELLHRLSSLKLDRGGGGRTLVHTYLLFWEKNCVTSSCTTWLSFITFVTKFTYWVSSVSSSLRAPSPEIQIQNPTRPNYPRLTNFWLDGSRASFLVPGYSPSKS